MDNTYKKYASYTAEELMQDDFFIESIIRPTAETDRFWMKAIEDEVISLYDYKLARYFVLSVQVPREPLKKEVELNLWSRIDETNKKNIEQNKKKKLRFFLTSLSGVAALIAVFFFLQTGLSGPETDQIQAGVETVKAPLSVTGTDIQLFLADNKAISVDGKEADIIYGPQGIAINNQQTMIDNLNAGENETFNQLIVPYGKRSMLTLAEGTRIWVNAGTRVVYPAAFNGLIREIYIDGEAFLDVEKDPERPFIVKTRDMSVSVLGTSFNIMAYETDTIQNVVLVEGSVKINANQKEALLSPNEMWQWVNGEPHVSVVDVNDYISWKSGIYQYESELLGTIVKRLSRYYGEEIRCNPAAAKMTCSGKLDLKDDLQRVLKGITHTAPVVYSYEKNIHTLTNEK